MDHVQVVENQVSPPVEAPSKGRRKSSAFGRLISRLASQTSLVAILIGLASLAGRAVLLPWVPIPKPGIQDEFSYLLAADTFAHGRLTNPAHPLWIHFETVHEIMRPTFQSKYPPLQGILLAVGQALFGIPWIGVWLSMGAMSAAIYWALAGWLPTKWALFGGVLALVQIGFFNYWSDSYWGGAAAAAAGALVIGSVARLRRRPSFAVAVTFAVGLALLANSRPYEGAVLGIACLAAVLIKVPLRRIAGPLALVLIPAGLWMAYYNYRVTGNALLLPYQVHSRQYDSSGAFAWEKESPAPHYNHETLRKVHESEQELRLKVRGYPFLGRILQFSGLARFYLGWPLVACTLGFLIPIYLRQPKMQVLLFILLFFVAGVELEIFTIPHYVAPGAALFYIAGMLALRRLRAFAPRAMQVVLLAIAFITLRTLLAPDNRFLYDKRDFIEERKPIVAKLDQSPGKQLVFVEYGPKHDVNLEWIYNRADIDAAQTVWAQTMGPEKDRELIEYFKDRRVWRLRDDGEGQIKLLAEPGAGESPR